MPGKAKKTKVVHVNLIEPFKEKPVSVGRLVSVVEADSENLASEFLSGRDLSDKQKADISQFVNKWKQCFTDVPGCTSLLKHW